MRLVINILLLVFAFQSSIAQMSEKPNIPLIKTKEDLNKQKDKQVVVEGKLQVFQPMKDGKPGTINQWEWEIVLADNFKVPIRGKVDTIKAKKFINKKVHLKGNLVHGMIAGMEKPGFRILYKDILPPKPDRHSPHNASNVNWNHYPKLKAIIDQYKGKVILMDFWASWCKPCIKEIKSSTLHDELHDQDIVFLYLGYNDKEKTWSRAKEKLKIEGEHILLDEATIKEAKELFKIIGIPWYAVIDKQGNIVRKKAPRPSHPELKEILLKELKK